MATSHLLQTVSPISSKTSLSDDPEITDGNSNFIAPPAYKKEVESSQSRIPQNRDETSTSVVTPAQQNVTEDWCKACKNLQFEADLEVWRWRNGTCELCLILHTAKNLARELNISPWKSYNVEVPYLVYDWTQLDIARSSKGRLAGFDLRSSAGRELTNFDDDKEHRTEESLGRAIDAIHFERRKPDGGDPTVIKNAQRIVDRTQKERQCQRSLSVNIRLPLNWFHKSNCKFFVVALKINVDEYQ
jgi:hypothetical protein